MKPIPKGKTLRDLLDEAYEKRDDGYHWRHYIQNGYEESGGLFILKAAIRLVVGMVPDIFPLDLPELVDSGKAKEMTDDQMKAKDEINTKLIAPIGGGDILEIINSAKKYIEESR